MRPSILALAVVACMSEVGALPDAANPPDCEGSRRCTVTFVAVADGVYREACEVEDDSLGEGPPITLTVETPCCEFRGSGGCPTVRDHGECRACSTDLR